MPTPGVTGLVFAGGLARRMQGRDKGLLPLHGRPLVDHVLERLAPQVDAVLINANSHREDYAAFGHPVIADAIGGHVGPLAGLHAGLLACTTPLVVTVPCDAPRLPTDLVARLLAALAGSSAPAAVAYAAERLQPTFMLCRRELRADLEHYLAGGGRKIHTWINDIGALTVPFDDASAFANINTPEELAELDNAGD